MRRAEAEKSLGGYATGTLTEAERSALFEAALDHQEIFDALADEEALRDLLADPEAKAHLLSALSSAAPPKVVPFWRRPGVIGAAASLIVAATAGLAYLRSPEVVPSRMNTKAEQAPTLQEAPKSLATPLPEQAAAAPARKAVPAAVPKEGALPLRGAKASTPPAASSASGGAAGIVSGVVVATSAERASAERAAPAPLEDARRAEIREPHVKQVEAAPVPSTVAMEVVAQVSPSPIVKGTPAGRSRRNEVTDAAVAGPAPSAAPVWSLELQADGRTRVLVTASRGAQVLILRRGPSGVAVLVPEALENRPGGLAQWRYLVPLAEGEALDLYLPKGPVAEPATLPETGPVEGYRARIHPAGK